jgi:hypothetical protein
VRELGGHESSSNEGVQGEAVPMTIRKAMCAEEGVKRASSEAGAGGRSSLKGAIAVSAEEVSTREYHPLCPSFRVRPSRTW